MEEELDEFEVLWPEACCLVHSALREPAAAAIASPPVRLQQQPSDASRPRAVRYLDDMVRSRPVDVPTMPARPRRWKYGEGEEEEDGERGGGKAIVPPHLLLSGRRQSEAAETQLAWTPFKRARDLLQLRNAVLWMTAGFIEG